MFERCLILFCLDFKTHFYNLAEPFCTTLNAVAYRIYIIVCMCFVVLLFANIGFLSTWHGNVMDAGYNRGKCSI